MVSVSAPPASSARARPPRRPRRHTPTSATAPSVRGDGVGGRCAPSSVQSVVQRPPAGTIPDAPGSYQFKDREGRVIYVGKARSLRQRLANYFLDPRHLAPRTAAMVAAAETVEWIQVRNEVEALMLEYSLIKQHRPRFNIRLRRSEGR